MSVKALIVLILLVTANSSAVPNIPDALRCGQGPQSGAIYIAHSLAANDAFWYYQVYAPQNRHVVFNSDGTYRSSSGHYGSVVGCVGKTLQQLKEEGRAFYFLEKSDNSNEKPSENQSDSEKKHNLRSEPANFWDYEQVKKIWYQDFKESLLTELKTNSSLLKNQLYDELKETIEKELKAQENEKKEVWYQYFKKKILAQIKENGLEIGSRWKLQQQTTYFVIRDLLASKDSRIAFPANTYLDPK